MKRTSIEAGVLIAAARGEAAIAEKALDILDDPQREFASSEFVKLEVLPKAVYYQREAEVQFYEAFFAAVTHWAEPTSTLVQTAYQEACRAGLSAVDALHVAAALAVNADELVTIEKPEKPLHRTQAVTVVSLQRDE